MNVGNNAGSGETNFEELKNPSTGSLNESKSTFSILTG